MNEEKQILDLIDERGPRTGQEILEDLGGDGLLLWRTCMLSRRLVVQALGTRYLRLDRRIEGFARLSPSILREFLTYSVVGRREDSPSVDRCLRRMASRIEEVSRRKQDLAQSVVSSLANQIDIELFGDERICFVLAGDITYGMAHDVPRPERSTGKLVKGSDIDLVVIADDGVPDSLMHRLDEAIYREKVRLLMAPHLREEIDYVVKNMDRVREQVRFDSFRRMVACKVLHEGILLCGSEGIFQGVKAMLKEHGIVEKLDAMTKEAARFRQMAEDSLLREDYQKIIEERRDLFFPVEESEEFE